MVLRDISIDLPYVVNEENVARILCEKNYARNEATTLDYQKNWKDTAFKFRLQTRCMASMFSRLMGKVVTKQTRKLNINCYSFEPEGKRISSCLGITELNVQFDCDDFFNLEEIEKKKKTLNLIMKGLKYFTQNENLDYIHFQEVYNRIIELNYFNQWTCKRTKSPNKLFFADLIITHNVDAVIFTVVIKTKQGHIVKTDDILSEQPDEFLYVPLLGSFSWISENEVVLRSKFNDDFWSVKI